MTGRNSFFLASLMKETAEARLTQRFGWKAQDLTVYGLRVV